jgi:hypothetical protein
MTSKQFMRICPSCGKQVFHTTKKVRDEAERRGNFCQKCVNKNKGGNRAIDYSGQVFNKLTALYFTGKYKNINKGKKTNRIWKFLCECGNECEFSISSVVKGHNISCGCSKKPRKHKDWTGQTFGMLTALREAGRSITNKNGNNARVVWIFRCECGKEIELPATQVVSGNTTSCGCKRANQYSGEKQLVYQLYLNYQKYDEKKQKVGDFIPFDIFEIMIKLPCHYCGREPFKILRARGTEIKYNGIDAKDPTRSHSTGNCVPCCWTCNKMKSNKSYDDFLNHIKLISLNILEK